MSNVDTELLVRHHSECKDLLIEALKYHLMPEQRGVLSNCRTRPRRCEGASPVLFAVGQYIKTYFQFSYAKPVSRPLVLCDLFQVVAVFLLYMETVRLMTPGQIAGTWWRLCLHDEPESELLLLGISCML